jgi:hypothetical protein
LTLPSSSATLATGDVIATHTVGGKEYQVVMVADDSGHLQQSLPTYTLWIPGQAVGANKLHWDLFNAAGSGKVIEVRGLWFIPKSDVGVTGTLGVEMGLYRTSAVGTGGTPAGYNSGPSMANPVITPVDTDNANLPAQITARAAPTGGATIAAPWWANYVPVEETRTEPYLVAFTNALPMGTMTQRQTLREGQGMLCKQGSVAGAGTIGALIQFTLA